MPRFFSATAYAGRLYVGGVPDRGPWNPGALIYWDERQVDAIHNPRIGDRKVSTAVDLREAVAASCARHPAIKVWIKEGWRRRCAQFGRTARLTAPREDRHFALSSSV